MGKGYSTKDIFKLDWTNLDTIIELAEELDTPECRVYVIKDSGNQNYGIVHCHRVNKPGRKIIWPKQKKVKAK